MATFVLDENVVVFATTRTNDRDEPDFTCSDLILGIFDQARDHRLAWSVEVHRRWARKADGLRREGREVDPTFMQLFALFSFSDRCVLPESGNPPALPGEENWSTKLLDDIDFVRLAACFRAILATSDSPLKLEIESLRLNELRQFQVLLAVECLPHL